MHKIIEWKALNKENSLHKMIWIRYELKYIKSNLYYSVFNKMFLKI